MNRFYYSGDVSPEYGGYLYQNHGDWFEVVRIQPCSDAGGPTNCYWIERLSVNMDRTPAEWANIMSTCGMTADESRPLARLDACLSYGAYDQDSSSMVRIGKPDPCWNGRDRFEPDTVLRGNTSILEHARRVAHGKA